MLSRISHRGVKGRYFNYYVQVPADWAQRMEDRGVRHVMIEDVGAKGVLILNPVDPARLSVMRTQKRRASRRNRYARTR